MNSAEQAIARVARALSWMNPPPVFIGGAIVGLFLDTFGREQLRITKDVDCILPGVSGWTGWTRFEHTLQELGWRPDIEGPAGRYMSPDGDLVDFVRADATTQVLPGAWFERAAVGSELRTLADGTHVRVVSVFHFLLLKAQAYLDRGRHDPFGSQDLEDIVAVLDGVEALAQRFLDCDALLREALMLLFGQIVADWRAREAMLGQLPTGGDHLHRQRRLRETLLIFAG